MVTKKIQSKAKIQKVMDDELPTHPPEIEVPVASNPKTAPTSLPAPDLAPPAPPAPTETVQGEKVDKEKVLTFVENIIDTLTFKRVGLIALLTVIGLGLYALFENRISLVDRIITPRASITPQGLPTWTLSEKSKTALQEFAKTTDVAFIAVTDVDLQKNRRTVRYYFVDDPVNLKLEPLALKGLSQPNAVFDYDAKNTNQMISVLLNEFRCDAFKDTLYFRYAPELADKLPVLCRIAVPPFVGQFVGFLTVGLSKNVTRLELDTIRLETARLAIEIYTNDVLNQAKTQ